jgi:hypothetical protein
MPLPIGWDSATVWFIFLPKGCDESAEQSPSLASSWCNLLRTHVASPQTFFNPASWAVCDKRNRWHAHLPAAPVCSNIRFQLPPMTCLPTP